jgi:glycosyltransferase involved in cell wall biosynthesis
VKLLYWSPYVGHVGTIKAVINSAAAMRRHGGHDVTLVRNHTEWEGYEARIGDAGVAIVDFGLKRRFPGLHRVRAMGSRLYMLTVALFGFFQLLAYQRRERPDVLIANLIVVPAILSTLLLRRRPRIVVSIQGFPKFLGSAGREDYPLWMTVEDAIRKWLWNRVYRHADLLVCMTESTRDKLIRHTTLPAERFAVINNPVIDDELFSLAEAPVDDPWLFAAGHKAVVAVGRLTPQKDFVTLIRAVEQALGQVPLRLAILGEGEERDRLQREIDQRGLGDRVRLYGFVANPFAYLKRADLFVLTSLWEDPGHAILEAAALRVPIVSTDCPSGPATLLADGAGGELCPVGDDACLGTKIAAALGASEPKAKVEVAYANAYRFSLRAHYDAFRPYLYRWSTETAHAG